MNTKLKYIVAATTLAAVLGGPAAYAAENINMKIANVLPAKAPRSLGAILVAKMGDADKRCPNIGMPIRETYNALKNKSIDAQENPITTSFFMKFYEVQKYMAITNHGTLDQVIMTSKVWWDKLTPACKQAISEAVDVTTQADGGSCHVCYP